MIMWLILLWIEMVGREVVGGKGGKGRMGIKRSEYQRWFFLGGTLIALLFFRQGRRNGE